MAFQIKNFASISASMINWMKVTQQKITDFSIGSIVRSMLEAIAAEIDQLYQQMFNGLVEAIPVATYNSFNFSALPELPATGLIRVTITSSATDTPIASGTTFTFSGANVTYTAENDQTITAGNTFVDVLTSANTAGSIGNCAQGQIFTMTPAPNGFVSATNLSPFANGVDAETDAERQLRFNAFIASLPRGTVAALNYGLKLTVVTDSQGNEIERVVYASVVEPYLADASQPIALVNCYIHNGVGSTSSALVTLATQIINGYYDSTGAAVPGWKAAGVNVTVAAATELPLAVTGTLTAAAGADKPTLVTQAQQAIATYIQGLDIGVPALLAEIITLVMSITGVANFALTAPTADTTADNKTKLMPGAITIS